MNKGNQAFRKQFSFWFLFHKFIFNVIIVLSLIDYCLPTSKIQVMKGLSSNKNKSVLKQKEIFLFWWGHQTTSINMIVGS